MTTRSAPVLLAVLLPLAGLAQQPAEQRVDLRRIEQRLEALARYGGAGAGVNRPAYSEADIAAREYIAGLMREAGLAVRIDAAGNLIGRREGSDPSLPVIMFGSHIDSVPDGGRYDGTVGVIAALEVIDVLNEHALQTRHPLEAVVFSNEEGGLIGSRAMIGELDSDVLDTRSAAGVTVREGIRAIGGDPDQLGRARYRDRDLRAFVELHIEQGATLYESQTEIGVVEGIVGIRWWDVIVEGMANHAGTTPMARRRDALLAAAELTLAINRVVTAEPGSQVGTVGRIAAEPGVPNVIPGRVVMSLELRDLNGPVLDRLYREIEDEAWQIDRRRGTRTRFERSDIRIEPAPTDEGVRRAIAAAARSLGLSYRLMPSGAGHDAQNLSRITPAGMIFVPSVDGISHSPRESSNVEDIGDGANVLLHTVLRLDAGAT